MDSQNETGGSEGPAGGGMIETAVRERYADASRCPEACLCNPSREYDPRYLKVIPDEIIERDYGCGDPSRWVREGETVLDLGSGSGKICYICAQKVGPSGRVIGVDFNQPMLDLARRHEGRIGEALGYHNTSFRKGQIQDLRLNLGLFEEWLAANPVSDADGYLRSQEEAERLRRESPLIAAASVDTILSNCVLNLVTKENRRRLFKEMFRVLKVGGRCVISDIVSDVDVPQDLQDDPHLWSGCVSGAFREDLLLKAFQDAGFHGITILERADLPWKTLRGIEFRPITVEAFKGKQGPCYERKQAVIYRGPWRRVVDDDGHVLERGRRMAVCEKTFRLYQREPYREDFYFVEPVESIPDEEHRPFECRTGAIRDPRETKGADPGATLGTCRGPGCC